MPGVSSEFEWTTPIRVHAPLAALPRPNVVAVECRNSPKYHCDGRHRAVEACAIFQYTLSGEGRLRWRGREFRVPPGTGFLCAANDPEFAYYFPDQATTPWRFVFLIFWGGGYREIVAELLARHGPVRRLPPDSPPLAALLALESHAEHGLDLEPGPAAQLVYNLLTVLADNDVLAAETPSYNSLVEQGMAIMEQGLLEGRYSVQEVAARLGVSREHFTRVFAHETGQPPRAWFTRRQMIFAARLVKDGNLPIKQISADLGFPSPEAFTKAFTRYYRLAPARFRRVGVTPAA